ncbi:4393_t:CDS:2 [Racocetra fulgida]|uniref:4393_t:CDS:1 n=1 Tax=Racocetra fulgida TaxID=60492 RepID=A0A9N9ER04_9GLOM|nr:4393_t:CDS:2 [Racocetra fulgida]
MDLEIYINYPEEEVTTGGNIFINSIVEDSNLNDNNSKEDKDDSREISLIIHYKALNAVKVLEQYLMQQDLSDKARLDHDQALLNLQKTIKKS